MYCFIHSPFFLSDHHTGYTLGQKFLGLLFARVNFQISRLGLLQKWHIARGTEFSHLSSFNFGVNPLRFGGH